MDSRRRVIAAAATALTAALAGCATGDSEPDDSTSATATTLGTGAGSTTATTDSDPTTATTDGGSTSATTEPGSTTAESASGESTIAVPTAPPATETVTVGPSGSLRFDPSPITVPAESTVEFRWDSGGHNVVVMDQPTAADWSGTSGGARTTYDTGHTHAHTFAVAGRYEYHCAPHQSTGMTGTIVVE